MWEGDGEGVMGKEHSDGFSTNLDNTRICATFCGHFWQWCINVVFNQ